MGFRNKLIIIYREYSKRVFVTIMMLSICLVSFYMSDSTCNSYVANVLTEKHKREIYKTDASLINKISFTSRESADDGYKILDYIKNNENIKQYGRFTTWTTNDLVEDNGIRIIISDKALIDMCNTGITKDKLEDMYTNWKGYYPVFLGASYKDNVKEGTTFTLRANEEVKCVVAGFLKKDVSWVVDKSNSINFYNLDNNGILFTDNFNDFDMSAISIRPYPIYYISEEGNSEELKNDILNYANENGIVIGIKNEEESNLNVDSDNIKTDKESIATLLLFVISIISIAAVTIIETLINKKDYAILMINGLKKSDIYKLIIIKNAILVIIPACLIWVIRQREIFKGIIPKEAAYVGTINFIPMKMAHCVYTPVILGVECLTMILISCIVPILIINKAKVIDILKGKW